MQKYFDLFNSKLFIYFFFLFITLFLYYPTRQAGFVSDYTSLAVQLQQYGFWDIFRNNWGFHAYIPVGYIHYWLVYIFFGLKSSGWYLVACIWHAANAALLFGILLRYFNVQGIRNIAFFSSLLFLISPFQAEVMVWRVLLHYLLGSFLMFCAFGIALSYLQVPAKKKLAWFFVLSLASLMSKEYAYMLPAIILVWTAYSAKFSVKKIAKNYIFLPLVSMLSVATYLLSNKLMLGVWIGYRGKSEAMSGSAWEYIPRALRYALKYVFDTRFVLESPQQEYLYKLLDTPAILWTILCGMGILYSVYRIVSKNAKALALPWLLSFVLVLAPSIYLFFPTLFFGENDRFGYYASWFLFPGIVLLIFYLKPIIRYAVLALLISVNVYYLKKINTAWAENGMIHRALIEDFRWEDAEYVFILNMPNIYKGLVLFRSCGEYSIMGEELQQIAHRDIKAKIIDVSQYNMMSLEDGLIVQKIADKQYKIEHRTWGRWAWRCAQGEADYENDYYKVHFIAKGFELTLKDIPPQSIFIYQDSLRWKRLDIGEWNQ